MRGRDGHNRLLDPVGIEWQSVSWAPPGSDALVLQDISIAVHPGRLTNVIGESGAGKSSLLRLAPRLIEPRSGQICVLGSPLDAWCVQELRRAVVYVAQRSTMLAKTVIEDLTTPLGWHGIEWSLDMVAAALAVVGLEGMNMSREMSSLSEGQLSRANLARALLLRPKVLLVDEPTAALDPKSAQRLILSLGKWAQSNTCTLVCATHRLAELDLLQGRTFVLLKGHVHGPYSYESLRSGELPEAVEEFVKQIRASR